MNKETLEHAQHLYRSIIQLENDISVGLARYGALPGCTNEQTDAINTLYRAFVREKVDELRREFNAL